MGRSVHLRFLGSFVSAFAAMMVVAACGPGTDPGGTGPGSGGAVSSGGQGSGGEGTSGGGGAPGGGAAPGGGGDSPDTGGSPATSGGASSGGGAGGALLGRIQVSRPLSSGSAVSSATASFSLRDPAPSTCTVTEHGPCSVSICPSGGTSSEGPRWDVGTITITDDDPEADRFTSTLMPNGESEFYLRSSSGDLTGGELISIQAEGGSLPAFTATIRFPLAPLLISPAVSSDAAEPIVPISIPRDQDLELNLDLRETSMEVHVQGYDSASRTSLSCRLPGAGVIPAEALAKAPVGTKLQIFSLNTERLEFEEGWVSLVAFIEMVNEDKTIFPYFVLE